MSFVTKQVGAAETFRIFYYPVGVEQTDANMISPFHDIPLVVDAEKKTFNYVNEIPKGTLPKMEIATKEVKNPIKQDEKNGKLREFTYGTLPFNYGALPQTWEDPLDVDADLKLGGDNDPLDVVEISAEPIAMGEVVEVKPVALLALLDEGEVDWKVIAINVKNPLAEQLNDVEDLEKVIPGIEATIREWFRNYKTTDGKPVNVFGYDEKFLNKAKTLDIINHTAESWNMLVNGKADKNKLWIPEI